MKAELLDHFAREDPKNIPAKARQAVLDRDNSQCQLCGVSGDNVLQLHHLTFRSQGGGHEEENLVTICWKCHRDIHEGRQSILAIQLEDGTIAFFPGVWRKK